jgi:hypothetical protein
MADGDREVLSSLPRTRPERRSAKRGARTAASTKTAAAKPTPRAKPRAKPKAVPPRKVPPAGYAVPKQDSPVSAGGIELVGTAIQAVGELANLGGRAVRDILGRLPKP